MRLIFLSTSVLNLHLESCRACVTVTGRHRGAPTQTCSCLFSETGRTKIQRWEASSTSRIWTEGVKRCWVSFPGAGSADGEMIEEVTLAAAVQGESQSSDEAGGGEVVVVGGQTASTIAVTWAAASLCLRYKATERPLGTLPHTRAGIAASITRCRLTGRFLSRQN